MPLYCHAQYIFVYVIYQSNDVLYDFEHMLKRLGCNTESKGHGLQVAMPCKLPLSVS